MEYLQILQLMVETIAINHWSRWLDKTYPTIKLWLEEQTISYSPKSVAESVYILLRSPPIICNFNQKPTFESYYKGYGKFCKHGCQCHKDAMVQLRASEDKAQNTAKYKQTMLDRYGVDNPSKYKESQQKKIQTNLDKYGETNPAKSQIIKDKIKQTTQDNWGVDSPMQSSELINRYKQTMQENYGVDYPQQSSEIADKTKITNLEKYGTEYTWQAPTVQKQIKQTNLERYGTENPSQSSEIQNKIKQTMLANWGAEYPSQVPELQEKIKSTNLERYGVEYTFQSKEFKENSKQTMLEKYGVPSGNSLHLTATQYDQLTNKHWLETAMQTMSISEIAQFLNVDVTTVYNRTRNFGLRPINGTSRSQAEVTITEYIRSLGFEVLTNDRTIIKPKELDIVIPKAKLAIEFCGLYWHSEEYKDKNYHKDKLQLVNDQGYQLITIFEDEWINFPNAIRSAIKHKLMQSNLKLFARKTTVHQIFDLDIIEQFYNKTHIQGWDKGSTLTYGLNYNSAYVAMMSFEKHKPNQMYLTRYATEMQVVGGASKLLTYFSNNNPTVNQIISFADLRWSNGNLYDKLGFKLDKIIPPDYQYVINGQRHHKFNFRKHNLKQYLKADVDINQLTETEIMKQLDVPKIWDCGKLRYVFTR